ncbi:hypothetical protein D3C75_1006660 [compost metagenome]
MILRQGEPRQLVEMGQQGSEGDRAADMGPLGQAEVAFLQSQVRRLGYYAVGGLHLGQIGDHGGARRQAEILARLHHGLQLGLGAFVRQAEEEALGQIGVALDGGVAAAKTQFAAPFIGYQYLVATALARQRSPFHRLGIYVASQAEV